MTNLLIPSSLPCKDMIISLQSSVLIQEWNVRIGNLHTIHLTPKINFSSVIAEWWNKRNILGIPPVTDGYQPGDAVMVQLLWDIVEPTWFLDSLITENMKFPYSGVSQEI